MNLQLFLTVFSIVLTLSNEVLGKPAITETDRQQYEIGTPMIIGGQDATSGQFPYIMSVEYFGATGWVHVCGATLIKPSYALTAARCVATINQINLRGYAGILERHNYTNAQQITFNGITVHPTYDVYTSGSLGDLAVLRFSWPADTSRPDIALISLPPNGNDDFVSLNCIAMGWGRYSTDQTFAWTLQWVELPIISNPVCYQMLSGIGVVLDSTVMCTITDPPGSGPCSGDAGGPLVCAPNGPGTYPIYAVGITSFTTIRNNMCDEFTPVVYTRTSEYLQWIDENTPN